MPRKLKELTERGAVQATEVLELFDNATQDLNRDSYTRYLEGYVRKLSTLGQMEEDALTRDEYELQLEALKFDTKEEKKALKEALKSGDMSQEEYDRRMYNLDLTSKNWNRSMIDEQAYGMTRSQAETAVTLAKELKGYEVDIRDYKEVRKISRMIRRGMVLDKDDWKVVRDALYDKFHELGDWKAAQAYIGKTFFGS
mgnify:CR=1 FL=1